jgi:hypothetical protein
MLARILAPVVVAAAALTLAGPAGAKSCGDIIDEGYTPRDIHATRTSCKVARLVSRVVAKVPSFGGCTDAKGYGASFQLIIREPCKRKGYRCHGTDRGQGVRVRCRRGAKRIRFDLG